MTPDQKRTWLPIIIQTLCLLGVMIGFALANEHRLTSLEIIESNSTERLADVCATVQNIQANQIKVLVMIDQISRRHEMEDRAAARSINP